MAENTIKVSNAASALGEAVGKLFESAVVGCLEEGVVNRNHTIRPSRLTNGTGNTYQIDAVVFDSDENPIIISDSKYIRYTKHNRDKASWLCVAHYNLRKTYPTIRKSIAVLAGRWSVPSKALVRSFGIEIFEVPFEDMVTILKQYGLEFNWAEKDRDTPRESWTVFCKLDKQTRAQIASELTKCIADNLRNAVNQVLDSDIATLPARISGVEVLIKTDRDELVLRTYDSVVTALQALSELVADRQDITDMLNQR